MVACGRRSDCAQRSQMTAMRASYTCRANGSAAISKDIPILTVEGIVVGRSGLYRGLAPDLPVLFSNRKSGFALSRKLRCLGNRAFGECQAAEGLEHRFGISIGVLVSPAVQAILGAVRSHQFYLQTAFRPKLFQKCSATRISTTRFHI